MIYRLIIFTFLFLFLGANFVFADFPPVLVSPLNNSFVTSSKLEWQIPPYPLYAGGSFYMIQVDNQQDFANPEKNNIYLKNNSYTPTKLNSGTWYWRVKAKNSAGIWSNWSEHWSFNLNDVAPIPAPTQTPSPTPNQTPKPSPTPIFTPQITPSPVSSAPSPQPTTSQQKTSAYQILAARATQNQTSTVAAVATTAPSILPTTSPIVKIIITEQVNIFKIAGVIILLAGITIMIFIFIKSNIKSKAL